MWHGLATHGPLARTTADAALLLDVLAGTGTVMQEAARSSPGRLRIALALRPPFTGVRSRLHPEISTAVIRLAEVLGNAAAGKTLDLSLLQQETALQKKLQSVAPKRVLFIVWTDPLISVGKHTFIADALQHAGAISVVESSQDWPQMSLEEMVRLQPEFLVFASGHSEAVSRDVEALAKRPGWSDLDAVKHRRFAVISDAVNRPAPRLFSAVDDLARQLHPEAFTEKSETSKSVALTVKN